MQRNQLVMSKILINEYYQNLDRTLQYGKSTNEQCIRNHFWHLLNDYARKLNYELIAEVAVMGRWSSASLSEAVTCAGNQSS